MAKKTKTKKSKKTQNPAKQSFDVISARSLIKKVLVMIKQNWKMFAIFTIIYGLFMLVLVQSPAKFSITDIKLTITDSLPEQSDNSTLIAGVLVGESTDIGSLGATYGVFLFIIFSLAMIYLLRAMYEGKQVRVRDGFYKGMYGLVPAIILYAIIMLQLLPMAIGGIIFSIVSLYGIAVNIVESIIIWTVLGAFILLSVYYLSASIMAVYLVTLPDVTPLEALKQAKKIVKGRRGKIMARLITGSIVYMIVAGAGLVFAIAVVPAVAVYWWWLVGVVALPVAHAYLYNLYRSLL